MNVIHKIQFQYEDVTREASYTDLTRQVYWFIARHPYKKQLDKVFLIKMARAMLGIDLSTANCMVNDALQYVPEGGELKYIAENDDRVLPEGYVFLGFFDNNEPNIGLIDCQKTGDGNP